MLSALAFAVSLAPCAASINDRPIIGVFTEPMGNETYIAASYVKFAESAGARVVPLHYDATDAELKAMFQQINGILFPGGGADIYKSPSNRWREAGQLLFDLAKEANEQGNHFPIHGTCLGFQLLHVMAAEDDNIICKKCYATEGTPLALNFTKDARTSWLFSDMSTSVFNSLGTKKLTENSHVNGVAPEAYEKNTKLSAFFRILSTNEDDKGHIFVSTVEAQDYPFTATQWHPEKNNFEWGKIGELGSKAIPHSADAVLVSQYMANNFVGRARLSSHRFSSADAEARALIYNYAPVPDPHGYFNQVYLWSRAEQAASAPVIV